MKKFTKVIKKNEQLEKYNALMVLACVGDTMGYRNSKWELEKDGIKIHNQLSKFTKNSGIKKLKIDKKWRYSDDTVLHIATAEALLKTDKKNFSIAKTSKKIAISYKNTLKELKTRGPGKRTIKSLEKISKDGSNWNKTEFAKRAGGCGASMRSACIGLVYNNKDDIDKLISISIESGRITHHNPIGFLGGFTSAYFTHLALNGVSINLWPAFLFEIRPKLEEYVKNSGRDVQMNLNGFFFFFDKWKKYLDLRNLSLDVKNHKEAVFPLVFGVAERDAFYTDISANGYGGSCGHDSVIIAYDSLLGCKGDWEELCLRAVLHGGDNDSTGTIACAWYGALFGFENVPEINYIYLENIQYLYFLGTEIYDKFN